MFLTPFFSFPMTAVHSNKKRDVTAFKSNEAYNIVEQRQMVGGGGGGAGGGRVGEGGIQEYEEIGTTGHPITRHQQPKSAAGRGAGGGAGGGGGGRMGASSASPQLLSTARGGGADEGLYEELPEGE